MHGSKRFGKKATAVVGAVMASALLVSCGTQVERASHNVSVEADNFNVDRRLVVHNTITGDPQLEMIGKFSITDHQHQLEVTVRTDDDEFKKHIVGLSPTVNYVIEDMSGADVSSTRHQISYLPEAIIPVEFKDGTNE